MGRAIASRKTAVGETVERLAGIAVIHLGKCWNHGINVSHSFCIVGLEKKNPKKTAESWYYVQFHQLFLLEIVQKI